MVEFKRIFDTPLNISARVCCIVWSTAAVYCGGMAIPGIASYASTKMEVSPDALYLSSIQCP